MTHFSYSRLMQSLASWGFLVVAPKSCPFADCQNWFVDVLVSLRDTQEKGGVFRFADFNRTGVLGHSMGGNAAVKIAALKDAVKELNIRASVGLAPATMFDNTTHPENIVIPTFFTTGTKDTIDPWEQVKDAFSKDTYKDRVLVSILGANHFEDTVLGNYYALPYYVHFLRCHVMDVEQACEYVYGDGQGTLCNQEIFETER